MSSIIICGMLNSNTPQQNAGVFIGKYHFTGWDSNVKANQGHGSTTGFFNQMYQQINVNMDSYEVADGVINDQDFKPLGGINM